MLRDFFFIGLGFFKESEIPKRIFGPKRESNGKWRKLHNVYHSPNIVRMIKSRRLRWEGHVVRMEEGRTALKILTGTTSSKETFRKA